jgi:ssDNA-binding Zn-finger/Zn-ribbon topoisomerase 1
MDAYDKKALKPKDVDPKKGQKGAVVLVLVEACDQCHGGVVTDRKGREGFWCSRCPAAGGTFVVKGDDVVKKKKN